MFSLFSAEVASFTLRYVFESSLLLKPLKVSKEGKSSKKSVKNFTHPPEPPPPKCEIVHIFLSCEEDAAQQVLMSVCLQFPGLA